MPITVPGASSIASGGVNNRVMTAVDANSIQGEANLLFDGDSLGLGVTPATNWHSNETIFQIGSTQNTLMATGTDVLALTQNAYVNTSSAFIRVNESAGASNFYQNGGSHYFRTVALGSGDITWESPLTVTTGKVTMNADLEFTGPQEISTTGGGLTLNGSAGSTGSVTIEIDDNRDDSFRILDSLGTWVSVDTRYASAGQRMLTLDTPLISIAAATDATTGLLKLQGHNVAYTGQNGGDGTTNPMTALLANVEMIEDVAVSGNLAWTVNKTAMLAVAPHLEYTNITIVEAAAIRVLDTNGSTSPTTQTGIHIEAITKGATNNYAINMAGTPVIHADLPAASAATNISLDGSDNFQQDTSSTIFKDDQAGMEIDSDLLYQLAPRSWTWNELSGSNGLRDFGFVAQEVAAVHPLLANWKGDEPWSNNWQRITTLLVAEVQKLKAEVLTLKGA
jgi:hypothetical protein